MKYVNETPREKVLRAHRLYEEIKSWYFSLSERDKEYYREYNPLLISTVELIIALIEGELGEYYDKCLEYRREAELVKNIPVLCIACMMRYWDPKIGCRREYYTGVECDLRFYCERLAKLIDWNWGKRPKGETIKKFLEQFICRFCPYKIRKPS